MFSPLKIKNFQISNLIQTPPKAIDRIQKYPMELFVSMLHHFRLSWNIPLQFEAVQLNNSYT